MADKFKVLTINNIAEEGLRRLPGDRYEVGPQVGEADAILLRSHKMHDMELPATLLAVARAGAGVNNIPVEMLSKRGIPVFNAPGANANAVKELVLGAILMAARNLGGASAYVRGLDGDDAALARAHEGARIPGPETAAAHRPRPDERQPVAPRCRRSVHRVWRRA